jgi:hypothetical protein
MGSQPANTERWRVHLLDQRAVRLLVIGGMEAAVREQSFDDLSTWIANGKLVRG